MIALQFLSQIPARVDSLANKSAVVVQQMVSPTNEFDVEISQHIWHSISLIAIAVSIIIITCVVVIWLPKIFDKRAEYYRLKKYSNEEFMSKEELSETLTKHDKEIAANYDLFEKFLEYSSTLGNHEIDVTICSGGNKLTIKKNVVNPSASK